MGDYIAALKLRILKPQKYFYNHVKNTSFKVVIQNITVIKYACIKYVSSDKYLMLK